MAAALADDRAVVALESTLLAHGLPRGDNRRVADELEQQVRDAGAVPATVAVLDGAIRVGLSASHPSAALQSGMADAVRAVSGLGARPAVT